MTRKTPNRKPLVELTISNHKLNIETARYNKIRDVIEFVLFVASILKMIFTLYQIFIN